MKVKSHILHVAQLLNHLRVMAWPAAYTPLYIRPSFSRYANSDNQGSSAKRLTEIKDNAACIDDYCTWRHDGVLIQNMSKLFESYKNYVFEAVSANFLAGRLSFPFLSSGRDSNLTF